MRRRHESQLDVKENFISFIKQAGLIALILNISMMVIAYYIAKAFASGIKQMRCIALECGLQNGTLALFFGSFPSTIRIFKLVIKKECPTYYVDT